MCVYTAHEKKTDAFDKRMTGGEKETKNEEERMREEKKSWNSKWPLAPPNARGVARIRTATTCFTKPSGEYRIPTVRAVETKKIEKKRWHPILREKKKLSKMTPDR